MTPSTSKELLCNELSKIIRAYPKLSVNDLTLGTTNCQDAYYKAIQTVSTLIKNGDTSGSITTINKLNIKNTTFSIYDWDSFERRHKMSSSTFESYKESISKVERLSSTNSITKILVGGYCESNKQYYYFDLKGYAYLFPIDVKLSNTWTNVA